MSNTNKRIASAVVLISIVLLSFYLGKNVFLPLVLLIGMIAYDEIFHNFIKKNRKSIWYVLSQLSILAPFILINYVPVLANLQVIFLYLGVLLNLILILYLFRVEMASEIIKNLFFKLPVLASLLISIPLICLSYLVTDDSWVGLFFVLIVITAGMDTGAWFFGKRFGKHKLWATVSPNKTIEGLLGGMLTACVLASVAWSSLFEEANFLLAAIFALLGGLSQVGDLIQSKIKRQYGVKDSSNLIPGHGGFYDRIDSLLFLAPFYAQALSYFYQVG